ncbi:hypothetical protein M422DRAFT_29360 [Sphaerobolus stellatus SS14]|uniref:Unplaced genomic scaffold SPHSTscaffold_135, whole genome shotgun sequence n=1 Tax=Sphaerobolus stellatus (strain SS14) TaxID=990650 RepID=A0A0C9W4A4_SPHS4|nr:hypothetical protein M422DRAFT_35409 [Sphaerobolus stellatus SS14]KIJ46181.1 hypothetical protein M422DRAFT_29360 [Sphaerobolus stellatus SS14]
MVLHRTALDPVFLRCWEHVLLRRLYQYLVTNIDPVAPLLVWLAPCCSVPKTEPNGTTRVGRMFRC